MEQKNLDTLVNKLQMNIDTKNYLDAYMTYQQILDIDSRNLNALYALLEVAVHYNEIDRKLISYGRKITFSEILYAIKVIFELDNNDIKIKAFACFSECLSSNMRFQNHENMREKEEYRTLFKNLLEKVVNLTNDFSLLFYFPKFNFREYRYNGNFPSYTETTAILQKISSKDSEFLEKIPSGIFRFMAVKKYCKQYNFHYHFIRGYLNEKIAVVIGDKCLFRISKNHREVYVLGSKLTLDINHGNKLVFVDEDIYHKNNGNMFADKNKNKIEFNEIIKKVKDSGGSITESDIWYYEYH